MNSIYIYTYSKYLIIASYLGKGRAKQCRNSLYIVLFHAVTLTFDPKTNRFSFMKDNRKYLQNAIYETSRYCTDI